jgi:uncharacterized protein (DUF1501 family)
MQSHAFTRRDFLRSGLVLASAAYALPQFLHATAYGLPQAAAGLSSIPGVPEDHVLVVVQLSGGNDGLNTVIPFRDDLYRKARPGIGIAADKVQTLSGSDVGLHPAMGSLRELYDEGLLAVVQGVGYPNPNRSHFKSMDIWHTADLSATGEGWLGRYFDSECCGFGKGESGSTENANPQLGVAIGQSAPLAMQGRKVSPLSFESAELFRWTGTDAAKALAEPYDRLARAELPAGVDPQGNRAFLTRTALDAQVSSDLIRKAVAAKPRVTYPGGDLSRQLQMVASMIAANLKTRVYYVSMGGFDTHSGQGGENGRHANLLRQYADAMKAFAADLKAQGNQGRVLTMTFSEFGRRVSQNASQGTDHGTAAPMFLMGPMVSKGVLTDHPSLSDLDAGDLKYTVDFREVYAGVLEKWLKGDSKAILEGTFKPAPVLAV